MSDTDIEPRVSTWNSITLHVWRWMPAERVRALAYISHGVGEYMGRYEKLAQELSENGIFAFGHDHVGHGRSGGEKVYIEDFSVYVHDVINHVKDFKASYPEIPCFLIGHSMGGLVASCVAIEAQDMFAGIVLSAAALEIDPQSAGAVTQFFARVLSYVAPRVGISSVNPAFISSLPDEVEMYENDPLVYHQPLKAKWAGEMIKRVPIAREKISKIEIPVLITHGTGDHLVPFSASEFISNNIGSSDKTFEIFDGDYHEILHDKGQERARNLIKDWIITHLD